MTCRERMTNTVQSEAVLGPMPPGWEVRYTATGRVYFVDHARRTTQFTDPRLTANINAIQQRLMYVLLPSLLVLVFVLV